MATKAEFGKERCNLEKWIRRLEDEISFTSYVVAADKRILDSGRTPHGPLTPRARAELKKKYKAGKDEVKGYKEDKKEAEQRLQAVRRSLRLFRLFFSGVWVSLALLGIHLVAPGYFTSRHSIAKYTKRAYNMFVPSSLLRTKEQDMIVAATARPFGNIAYGQHFEASAKKRQIVDWHIGNGGFYLPVPDFGICAICFDPRLDVHGSRIFAPRLAGGIVTAALMYATLYNCRTFEEAVDGLATRGFRPVFHTNCGALKLGLDFIRERLSQPNPDVRNLLELWGFQALAHHDKRICRWAATLPDNFITEGQLARLFQKYEVEDIDSEFRAAKFVVSYREDEAIFGSPPKLLEQSGTSALFFDTPVLASITRLFRGKSPVERQLAVQLGMVYNTEVGLALASPLMEWMVIK